MRGFTLIELILVMGLFAVIASFSTVNLLRPQTKFSLDGTVTVMVADLKSQQLKAMIGDSEGDSSSDSFGVYFGTDSYTLFKGASFLANPQNFTIALDANLTIASSNFPDSQVVFSRLSGEVPSQAEGKSVTIKESTTGEEKTIIINKLGVVTIN